jgi:hypothetical protein
MEEASNSQSVYNWQKYRFFYYLLQQTKLARPDLL